MTDEKPKHPIDRATWIFIIVGFSRSRGPGSLPAHGVRPDLRKECKVQCAKIWMDYRVIALGAGAAGEYPAECRCIEAEEKKWWQLWR